MKNQRTSRQKATIVGLLIVLAYSMLTYDITGNRIIGMIMDIVSGLSVIVIAAIMYPIFAGKSNRTLNFVYLLSRVLEGAAMVVGGVILLSTRWMGYRSVIYEDIQIYFFLSGALFFYLLLYQSRVIPSFLSIWGIFATVLLTVMTFGQMMGVTSPIMSVLVAPMILNEVFLAIWLIIKGFTDDKLSDKQQPTGSLNT